MGHAPQVVPLEIAQVLLAWPRPLSLQQLVDQPHVALVPRLIRQIHLRGIEQPSIAHLLLLGSNTLLIGTMRLKGGCQQTGRQRGKYQRRGYCSRLVPAYELGAAVRERVIARNHRLTLLMPPDVFREFLRGRVSARRLLPQGHQSDVVQVSSQSSPQRPRPACPSTGLRRVEAARPHPPALPIGRPNQP